MMRGAFLVSGFLLIGLSPLSAQDAEIPALNLAGNLPADFYIKSNCQKPIKPSLPKPISTDREGVLAYNETIRRYNKARNSFDTCINAYVDKAPTDIDWIVFMANSAVAKVNRSDPPTPPTERGNMPPGFYPSPDCIAPDQPSGATPDGRDLKAMDAHNSNVRTFNVLAKSLNACIQNYVIQAKVDIQRIENAEKDAALQASEQ